MTPTPGVPEAPAGDTSPLPLRRCLERDVQRYGLTLRFAARLALHALQRPGLAAVVLLRLQQAAAPRSRMLASVIRFLNLTLTGLDCVTGAAVGAGLKIEHPNGIVLGRGVRIGTDCTLLHQVTLGELVVRDIDAYPVVGDGVVLGAGCKVLGPITIGNHVVIAANAVVTRSVPDCSRVRSAPMTISPAVEE